MQTKTILKIWSPFVNFEKFSSVNLSGDQSQPAGGVFKVL